MPCLARPQRRLPIAPVGHPFHNAKGFTLPISSNGTPFWDATMAPTYHTRRAVIPQCRWVYTYHRVNGTFCNTEEHTTMALIYHVRRAFMPQCGWITLPIASRALHSTTQIDMPLRYSANTSIGNPSHNTNEFTLHASSMAPHPAIRRDTRRIATTVLIHHGRRAAI